MNRISWVLTLCVVLSYTHAVRVQRSVLQSTSAGVSSDIFCPSNTIRVDRWCYPSQAVNQQLFVSVAASIGGALSDAIVQAENGGSVSTIAASFSQALIRAYARIISSQVLYVMRPEDEDVCVYTGEVYGRLANDFALVLTRAFATSENEYVRAGAQCFPRIVVSTSAPILQSISSAECTNFGTEFIYQIFERANYSTTLTGHVSDLLNGILARNAQAVATMCDGGRRPSVVTSG